MGFILLYPKFPLLVVTGTYVPVRIEDLLIAFLLLLWFLSNLKNLRHLIKQPITQIFLLFWGIGFLSLMSAFLITYFVPYHLGILHWLRRIEDMSLFFVAATTLKNIAQIKVFLVTILIVAVIVSVYGFGQVYFHFPVVSTTNSEFSKGLVLELSPGARPNSTFAGHYDLAIFLSVVLIFISTLFFYYPKIWQKILLILTGILSAGLLGLTAARASFAATIISLILVFWSTGKKILIVGLIIASLVILVASPQLRHRLVATITVNLLSGGGPKYTLPSTLPQPSGVVNKFSSELMNASGSATGSPKLPRDIAPGEPINTTELGVERSFNIRTDVEWPRAYMAFKKNPLLGTGYASLIDIKGNALATDNDFLRSLGETGILGTAALILCFYLISKKIIKAIKLKQDLEKIFLIASFYSALAILLTGTVIDVFEASKVATLLWVMLGMAWAVASDYEL